MSPSLSVGDPLARTRGALLGDLPAAISGFTAPPSMGVGFDHRGVPRRRSRIHDSLLRISSPPSRTNARKFSSPARPPQYSPRPSRSTTALTAAGFQTM